MKVANTFLPSLQKKNSSPGQQYLRVLLRVSYFSQILKADLDGIKLPKGMTLLHSVDDLLLCSTQASSQEDSIYLLKLLALKGQNVTKEKLQFAEIQV